MNKPLRRLVAVALTALISGAGAFPLSAGSGGGGVLPGAFLPAAARAEAAEPETVLIDGVQYLVRESGARDPATSGFSDLPVIERSSVWSPVTVTPDRLTDRSLKEDHSLKKESGWSILYFQAPLTGTYQVILSIEDPQSLACVYSNKSMKQKTYVSPEEAASSYSEKIVTAREGHYIAVLSPSVDFTVTVYQRTGFIYDIPRTEMKIREAEEDLFTDGWQGLPSSDFSLCEWGSYTEEGYHTNRVKYNYPLLYERDVTLMAASGFYLDGYWADGTYADPCKSLEIPANTPFKVSVRRIREVQEAADPEEFAAALTVSTPLAGMEKDRTTFTDASMFERIGIGGDSYASGGGIISGVRALTWGKNLERQCGSTVEIYARSGRSIHSENGWNYDAKNGLPALLAGEECGLYWLAHGINSAGSGEVIGDPSDMAAEVKPFTFYGQYVYAIEAIQATFPRARIVLATVTGSSYKLADTKYAAVNTAIRNIANYCQIPVIELTEDDFYRSQWYSKNCLSSHPTAMLCAGMAMANRRLLSRCILSHPDYFVDYGSSQQYAVSCPPSEGGRIYARPGLAKEGEVVTLLPEPLPGYHFAGYEAEGAEISEDRFRMPGEDVRITGLFEPD